MSSFKTKHHTGHKPSPICEASIYCGHDWPTPACWPVLSAIFRVFKLLGMGDMTWQLDIEVFFLSNDWAEIDHQLDSEN